MPQVVLGERQFVPTSLGYCAVTITGDRRKTPCLTFHDVGTNHETCFASIMLQSSPGAILGQNCCFYHIDVPGSEARAAKLDVAAATMTMDKLVVMTAEIVSHFKLQNMIGLGVGGGAWVLAAYAARYPQNGGMTGLVLMSPPTQTCGWGEYISGNNTLTAMSVFGLSTMVRSHFLNRLYSYTTRNSGNGHSHDFLRVSDRDMSTLLPAGVYAYYQALLKRPDLSEGLLSLTCRVLLVLGEESMYYNQALELSDRLQPARCQVVSVPEASILACDDRPEKLYVPLRHFLQRLQDDALSCEALQAAVIYPAGDEAGLAKPTQEIFNELQGFLDGSKQVAAKKKGTSALQDSIDLIAEVHGALTAGQTHTASKLKPEMARPASRPDKAGHIGPSRSLLNYLLMMARTVLDAARLSLERLQALAASMPQQQDVQLTVGTKVQQAAESISAASSKLDSQRGGEAPSLQAALALADAVDALQEALAAEAFAALLSLRQQAGPPVLQPNGTSAPEPDAGKASSPAKPDKKAGKKKGKQAGLVLGKGTGHLLSALAAAATGMAGEAAEASGAGPEDTDIWQLIQGGTAGELSTAIKGVQDALDPLKPGLEPLLSSLRSIMEANQARRRPKVAKGARDLMPAQMMVRQAAIAALSGVFTRHGAVAIDTPVFELRETLTGKYGEDSKLIYDLADQGGEILSLRYDLTVPFARYVALHGISQIKRYHMAKVYRRDNPQMNRGRFREFMQCDFDIAGSYPPMIPDAEVLKVASDALTKLGLGEFEIKLNHRQLLDAMMALAGVPASKTRAICSAIDKLDKEPWSAVRAEMVDQKGLAPAAADRIHSFILSDDATSLRRQPQQLLEALSAPSHPFTSNADARAALDQMHLLFSLLERMQALDHIAFDLTLARGLDYYTGVIYEVVLVGGNVGAIAAGGRYDGLVGMFSGKDVPAVGVSFGIERMFNILEEQALERAQAAGHKLRESETQVLVGSIGKNLQPRRLEICQSLWAAGIAAEFGYKANPVLKEQWNYAEEQGIPLMLFFGAEELEQGTAKIKILAGPGKGSEDEIVQLDDILNVVQLKLRGTEA
ncbi:hypothetical protein WJX84_002501 [Apatococcus fuscideae]|uniref:Histidine--tRNA ligase, cytoplasmic n=1 Tax=Apatococcus fuscideae TaxID=2026836 RepID=A0AAW1TDA6_9CHLO